ncbi:MAG: acyl carrier protein [Magnetococcales bacterium]|nr:acyl carrier protein [Magnetococcales bacterium]
MASANYLKLKRLFAESLGIPESQVVESLSYNTIPQWDSIAHMAMIANLDDAFGIMMDTDDVIDLSSFGKALAILAKYGIAFDE